MFSLDVVMVDFRKVKRWFMLFLLFVRLILAFFNPIHQLFLDTTVYKIWKMAVHLEKAIDDASVIFIYQKRIDELLAEFVSVIIYEINFPIILYTIYNEIRRVRVYWFSFK